MGDAHENAGSRHASPAANSQIAVAFERIATLLEAAAAEPYRVAAYRRAAAELRNRRFDIAALEARGGMEALMALPGIGSALASEIVELLRTGKLRLLDRLEEQACPRRMLAALPGIGPVLAARVVDNLGVRTLETLEETLYDGRLARVPGFGAGRLKLVRQALAQRLSGPRVAVETAEPPPVALLLELDRRYRAEAAAGHLHKVAPHRFNPKHRSWLPVMRTTREGWQFDIMFSNTERAHRLHAIHDWVVISFERDGATGHCTVVTEHHGPDSELRVIRGREEECHRHYLTNPPPRPNFELPEWLRPRAIA